MSDLSTTGLPAVPGFDPSQVERALRRLPFAEREALLLKVHGRLSYAEIGAVLGLTAAQAEARTASALVRLVQLLMHSRPTRPECCRSILRRCLTRRRA